MNWDNGNWFGHCWLRLRAHRFEFLSYTTWPHTVRDICQCCGRLRTRKA